MAISRETDFSERASFLAADAYQQPRPERCKRADRPAFVAKVNQVLMTLTKMPSIVVKA
jgi:hypothetical protein